MRPHPQERRKESVLCSHHIAHIYPGRKEMLVYNWNPASMIQFLSFSLVKF